MLTILSSRRVPHLLIGCLAATVFHLHAVAGESGRQPSASGVQEGHPAEAHGPASPPAEPPARLTVDAPLPGPLQHGAVVIPFHAEHVQIVPVYGEVALGVSPRLGHLHLTLDQAPWHWLQASDDLIVVQGLAAGSHTLRVDLANTAHQVLDSRTVAFTVPAK